MKEHNFSIQEVESTEWLHVPYVCKIFFFANALINVK